jgi:hypothetical protein
MPPAPGGGTYQPARQLDCKQQWQPAQDTTRTCKASAFLNPPSELHQIIAVYKSVTCQHRCNTDELAAKQLSEPLWHQCHPDDKAKQRCQNYHPSQKNFPRIRLTSVADGAVYFCVLLHRNRSSSFSMSIGANQITG